MLDSKFSFPGSQNRNLWQPFLTLSSAGFERATFS